MVARSAQRQYLIQLFGVLVLYGALLTLSLHALGAHAATWAFRVPVALLPALGAALLLLPIVRYVRAVDEFERRVQFEAIVLAFAATAVTTFTYGFLENVGFPQLNWMWVWPVMAAFWIAGRAIAVRRYG
ncbi:MAG TPA: hypothetical protein VGO33_14890 [Gemmatimonadaceae bacterium]|jgi:hypothetical protein|nr:hypothetical protein [Gemmatimonadaceae bacterium]